MPVLPYKAIVDSEKWAIEVMGRDGLYASAIIKKLKQMGKGDFTASQIYRIWKDAGVSSLDYRQGAAEGCKGVYREAFQASGGKALKKATTLMPKPVRTRTSGRKRRKKGR